MHTHTHTQTHIHAYTNQITRLNSTVHIVGGSGKSDVGGSAVETSSYGTTRHSRYSSSRTEEQISSNGNLNAVTSSTSATSYFAITGEDGVGKPIIKKTCKGVTIERKCTSNTILKSSTETNTLRIQNFVASSFLHDRYCRYCTKREMAHFCIYVYIYICFLSILSYCFGLIFNACNFVHVLSLNELKIFISKLNVRLW